MPMSAVRVTKNRTIEFTKKKVGGLLDQDYVFKFCPNISDEPNHVMIECGHKDNDDKSDAFILTIDQLKKLAEVIDEVLFDIDSTKNAINQYANFVDDMCSRIEDKEVTKVELWTGEPVTLDQSEDFFGNIYMHLDYYTKNGVKHSSDIISNEVEEGKNDTIAELMKSYVDKGLLERFDFVKEKYDEVKKSILERRVSNINFDDLFSALKKFESSVTGSTIESDKNK